MSKQTKLNFSSLPSKRRKLNSEDGDNTGSNESSKNMASSSRLTSNYTQEPPPSKRHKNSVHNNDHSEKASTDFTPFIPNTKSPKAPSPKMPTTSKTTTTEPPTSSSNTTPTLTLTYHRTSLFTSPPHTILCHATNAQGTWGGGIALAFKKSYPAAYTLYHAHCKRWPSSALLGTAFLIPPQTQSASKAEREAGHWIGCLFTSEKKGKQKGSVESILAATREAVGDLVRRVGEVNAGEVGGEGIVGVRMCKINQGLFEVPWEETAGVLEGVEGGEGEGGVRSVGVYHLD